MQKSIFAKYFSASAAISLVSLAVVGILFSTFSANFLRNDKYQLLMKNAKSTADFIENAFGRTFYYDGSESFLGLRPITDDSCVFVTDADGHTIYCSETYPCAHTTFILPDDVIEKTAEGEFSETGTLSGIYKESCYTVGVPINNSSGEVIGFVFSSMPAKVLSNFLLDFFNLLIISELIVLALSFIIAYFVSLQLTKPLREMADAAKRIGQGDFSKKLQIQSMDEVGQLAAALNNMSQSLSMTESSRRSFVANVSHELKTPMTSIGGFIDGILDGTIPPERQDYYLQLVSDEVKRLTRLVRSMLNLSRIEAGENKLNPANFNIVDTVCRAVFTFESNINEKNLEIRGLDHDKIIVNADEDMIFQVIYNLTENAVKFTDEGGYIEFRYTNENDMLFVSVRNSGAGLSKDEISHVFERFYKTDRSRGLDKNGVGLGLNIAQTIVGLHGGEMQVKSELGKYTEFTFTLPQKTKQLKASHSHILKKNSNTEK